MNKLLEKFNIDIEKVLFKLKNSNWQQLFSSQNINKTKGWTQFNVVCPFHDDKSPSLWINSDLNIYNCFVCTGRVWELKYIPKNKSLWKWTFITQFLKVFFEIRHQKQINIEEIADICEIKEKDRNLFYSWLKEKKGISSHKDIKKVGFIEDKKIRIEELKKYINNDSSYIYDRINKFKDLSDKRIKETIIFFYLGYDKVNLSITIPIFQDYYLKGIYWRKVIKTTGKYINIEVFRKTEIIYNYDEINKNKPVILVEGPLNAVRLWALGYTNVISLFWANIYNKQIEKLQEIKELIVWFDSDFAGQEWQKKIKEVMKWKKISFIKTEGKKDVYDFSKQEITELFKSYI